MKIVSSCRVYKLHKPFPGGMINVIADRAEELARRGHEVHVATTAQNDGKTAVVEDNGVTVHYLPCKPFKYSPEYYERCIGLCNRLRPDIIHADSTARYWWLGRPGGAKRTAMTSHGTSWSKFISTWNGYRLRKPGPVKFCAPALRRQAESMQQTDVNFAISRFEYWQIRDVYGCTANTKLLYNPLPDVFFATPAKPVPKGGYAFLCKSSPSRGVKAAEQGAKAAGVPFKMVSGIKREDMPAVYDGARALCIPEWRVEGFDLTIGEAAARGRQAILGATGPNIMEAMDSPWIVLVPSDDAKAVARALKREPPKVEQSMANRYRLKRHVDKWLEALA